MKVKVCGMRNSNNIAEIKNLKPDFMGFIFYKKSSRYFFKNNPNNTFNLSDSIKKVGVFVNSPVTYISEIKSKLQLDYVQLHGDETLEVVEQLSTQGIKIIKAFQINQDFKWSNLSAYNPFISYFLFDTPCHKYGGSGKKFDWNLLKNYSESIPFFLAGGIGVDNIQELKNLNLSKLYAIDINSKFESEPGIKNVELVKQMIKICK